jgi:general secretion pathway protein G
MRKHKGFTLVELVVVIMILGILAAVAAPKLLNTSTAATNNGLRQTLATVRDAIERYAAQNGGVIPAKGTEDENQFTQDLKPYLRGSFPTSPVGSKDNHVTVVNGDALTVDGLTGWMYSSTSGEFICNCGETGDGETVAYSAF